jgi:hypothetical protein
MLGCLKSEIEEDPAPLSADGVGATIPQISASPVTPRGLTRT